MKGGSEGMNGGLPVGRPRLARSFLRISCLLSVVR